MRDVLDIRSTTKMVHPIWLWIDPTSRCNLACRLCYTKFSHGKLDLEPSQLEETLGRLAASDTLEVKGIHLNRSEEHTSGLQSLMRISYAVFCLKKKKKTQKKIITQKKKNYNTITNHNSNALINNKNYTLRSKL